MHIQLTKCFQIQFALKQEMPLNNIKEQTSIREKNRSQKKMWKRTDQANSAKIHNKARIMSMAIVQKSPRKNITTFSICNP